MVKNQIVDNPFGITVFGSAIIKVEPDIVSIHFGISRTEKHPKDSFASARKASQSVNGYLQKVTFKKDVNSSRIKLSQAWQPTNRGREFVGYMAQSDFHVLLYELDHLENLLVGLVDNGVNEIEAVNFQTSKLKELRAEARRQAVNAAKEKAENYCTAAGVKLGAVLHIEDVNPDELWYARYESGHMRGMTEAGAGDDQAFSPGNIAVNAAVLISFDFADD